MKIEEKKALKDRIQKADEIERRLKYLDAALELLESKEPLSLQIPLYDGAPMYYRNESNARVPDGFREVCWSDDEPDVGPAMLLHLKKIIVDKILAAHEEYDAL